MPNFPWRSPFYYILLCTRTESIAQLLLRYKFICNDIITHVNYIIVLKKSPNASPLCFHRVIHLRQHFKNDVLIPTILLNLSRP